MFNSLANMKNTLSRFGPVRATRRADRLTITKPHARVVFPRLAKDGAFTADEMKQFVGEASTLGIDVIPEIESLGHTRYITRLRTYRTLGAAPKKAFNSLDPRCKAVRVLLTELFEDTAAIFRSDILHVGLDERHELHEPADAFTTLAGRLVRRAGASSVRSGTGTRSNDRKALVERLGR